MTDTGTVNPTVILRHNRRITVVTACVTPTVHVTHLPTYSGLSPCRGIMAVANQRQELNRQSPRGHEPGELATVGNLPWRLRHDAEQGLHGGE